MLISDASGSRAVPEISTSPSPSVMSSRRISFHGVVHPEEQHCSAPPLQRSFRLPRLSRDAEAVTRPRAPLRAVKWEDASECEAVVEFALGALDEIEVKVEAEAPVEGGAEADHLCARVSAVKIATPARAADHPRKPGRPKGSKSRPRVKPHHDRSAPPEREEARKALARIARR